MNRVSQFMLCIILVGMLLLPGHARTESSNEPDRVRVFGVLPIVSPEKLVRRFEPLIDYLTKKLNVPIVMETAPNYAEFVRRTHQEKRYDYLLTAPHFYYLAQREAGYRVVARVDGALMSAVIVTRHDSDILTPQDLCGKRVSTPDTMALGTLLVRERLVDAGCVLGVDTVLIATPSHNAALYSAYLGASDAAGLMTTPLARADPEVRAEIRVVAETEQTPNMPFSVAPWIRAEEAALFADALAGLKSSPEGRALLNHLGWSGFTAAQPKEYDIFKEYSEAVTDE